MAQIVAVVAAKGGTGKTVVAGNLAAACATDSGLRVLAVDCDPQADLTLDLGVEVPEGGPTLADVLEARETEEEAPLDAIYDTSIDRLRLIPGGASLDLLTAALHAAGAHGEDLLSEALTGPLVEDVDIIVLDTPPNLGPLTVGAMIAADLVLMPCNAQDLRAVAALPTAIDLLERLVEADRSHARAAGVLVRVDSRRIRGRRMSRWITDALTGDEPQIDINVLGQISEHVSIHHAPMEGRPTIASKRDSRVGVEFAKLGKAVLEQMQGAVA